jgi:hypothetical protein
VRVTETGCEVIGNQSVCPRELHLK